MALQIDLDTISTSALLAELANADIILDEPGPSHCYSPEEIGAGRIQFWPDARDEDDDSPRPTVERGSFILAVRAETREANDIVWQASRVASLGDGRVDHESGMYYADTVASDRVAEMLTQHGLGDAFAGEWTDAA